MKSQLYKFYEGAMEAVLPECFMNVAAVRYVPDHQEIFTDPEHDVTLTMEIMQPPPSTHTGSAVRYFFEALGKGNDASECVVEEESQQNEAVPTPTSAAAASSSSTPSSPPPVEVSPFRIARVTSLVGLQRDVKRYAATNRETSEEGGDGMHDDDEAAQSTRDIVAIRGDDLRVYMAAIHVSGRSASGEETQGYEVVMTLSVPVRFGNPLNAKEYSVMEPQESAEIFKRALESFKINDYLIFAPPASAATPSTASTAV